MKIIESIDNGIWAAGDFLDEWLPYSLPLELLFFVMVLPWLVFRSLIVHFGYEFKDED